MASKSKTVRYGRVEVTPFDPPQSADFVPDPQVYKDPHGYRERVAWAWERGWDVLLLGPTGVGKTSLVRSMCADMGRGYRRFPCQEATDTAGLIGKPWLQVDADSGKQEMLFQRGIAYEALLDEHVLLLDEWNLAHPDVQLAINPLFRVDEGMLIVTENEGEIVPRGQHFRLVATGNPATYAGVKAWNPAALSRFDLVLWMDYLPERDEVGLLVEKTGISEEIATYMVRGAAACRAAVNDSTLRFPFSYRELENWCEAAPVFGIEEGSQVAVINKCEQDDQEAVFEMLRGAFPAHLWARA